MSKQEEAAITFFPRPSGGDTDDQWTLLLRPYRRVPEGCRVVAMVTVLVTAGVAAALFLALISTLPLRSVVAGRTEFCTRNYTMGDTCLVRIDTSFCSGVSLTVDLENYPNASALLDVFPFQPELNFTAPVLETYSDVVKRGDYHLQWSNYLHPGSLLQVEVCAKWASDSCVPSWDKPEQHFAFFIFQGKDKYERFLSRENFDSAILHREFDVTTDCNRHLVTFSYPKDGEYYHVVTKVAPSDCEVQAIADVRLQQKQYNFTGTERDIACRVDRLSSPSCSWQVDGRHYAFATVYDINGSPAVSLDEKLHLRMSCLLNHGFFAAIAVPIVIVVIAIVTVIVVYSVCDQRHRNETSRSRVTSQT